MPTIELKNSDVEAVLEDIGKTYQEINEAMRKYAQQLILDQKDGLEITLDDLQGELNTFADGYEACLKAHGLPR
jgi:hypothetical protein